MRRDVDQGDATIERLVDCADDLGFVAATPHPAAHGQVSRAMRELTSDVPGILTCSDVDRLGLLGYDFLLLWGRGSVLNYG
jgi:hypothetical protein